MPGTAESTAGSGRLLYVDRLRILATAVIFAYHSARPFDDFERWHVKYNQVSSLFTYPMAVGSQFALPLFWILSGIVTWTALDHHSPGRFLGRRLLRLGVPVVLVGWWVLCPPQLYVEATTGQHYLAPPFAGSYPAFLGAYATSGIYGRGGFFPLDGLHLWYLAYLALFTAVAMPVFLLLRSPPGRRLIERAGSAARHWWLLPVLGVPVYASELLVDAELPVLGWYQGGWRFTTYFVLLVLGFVLGADARLRAALEHRRRLWLALAGATLVPLLLWSPTLLNQTQGTPEFLVEWGLRALNGWLCLLALLGYGARHLDGSPGAVVAASAELVLPFYILHQTVIVLAVAFIRDWTLPVWAAWGLVMVVAFAVSGGTALLITRSGALRFLFGLSRRPHAARLQPVAAP